MPMVTGKAMYEILSQERNYSLFVFGVHSFIHLFRIGVDMHGALPSASLSHSKSSILISHDDIHPSIHPLTPFPTLSYPSSPPLPSFPLPPSLIPLQPLQPHRTRPSIQPSPPTLPPSHLLDSLPPSVFLMIYNTISMKYKVCLSRACLKLEVLQSEILGLRV